MSLDFTPVHTRQTTLGALVANLGVDDLRAITNAQLDTILEIVSMPM
jgi:hypothetical protein